MQAIDIQLNNNNNNDSNNSLSPTFRSCSPDIITYPYPLCKSEEERLKAMALKPNQVNI
jgi:hypothetical protein